MLDDPVVLFLVPFSHSLDFLEFFGNNEVFDDHILRFELVSQLENGVVHVVSLSVKVVLNCVECTLSFIVVPPDLIKLLLLELQLFLQRVELVLSVEVVLFNFLLFFL